jgi:alkanesulfonate monooxygenase SsuD/methylene tetrahydromethanopterin reductase-like flavin-dependent oxidoreductase (luciferase family)
VRFGIHNSSWLDNPDPAEAFEAVKAKAQWAEDRGGGEQMTLRAVARLADACNIVGGDIAEVRHKLAVLRGHCDEAGRDYDTIEKTHVEHRLLARDAAAVAAKRERLAARGPLRGFVGTVSEAIDLIGQYQNAGVDFLINSNDQRNDEETRELFVSDVMPHFA